MCVQNGLTKSSLRFISPARKTPGFSHGDIRPFLLEWGGGRASLDVPIPFSKGKTDRIIIGR